MQERHIAVKEGGSNGVAIFAIVAVLAVVGAALYFRQPWNGTTHNTAIINASAAAGGAKGPDATSGGSSGASGTSGSGSSTSGN